MFAFLRADCLIAAFDTHREADLLPASEVTRRLRDWVLPQENTSYKISAYNRKFRKAEKPFNGKLMHCPW
jgi:hypothetical protein